MSGEDKPRVGTSACLLGRQVRYDGGHKRHDWVVDVLGPQVEWVPICPEVEFGMSVPREPIQLVPSADPETLLLITAQTRRDITEAMRTFSAARVEALASERLSGFVLKTKSPSCGLTQVKVYDYPGEGAPSEPRGRGFFAAALVARYPDLPVIEEHSLDDPAARERFLHQVLAHHARPPRAGRQEH